MKKEIKEQFIVYDVKQEAPGVSTLKLLLKDKPLPPRIAGQYLTVYFPETSTPEGKAYSLSNSPSETMYAITVKAIGEFSNRLTLMKPGDTVTASLPYGYFYSESDQTHLIMVAAGIGIAPFRSMITHFLENNPSRKLTLLYSARMAEDLIFKSQFDRLQELHPSFAVRYFVTREPDGDPALTHARITGNDIIRCAEDMAQCEFLLCGSISFVRDLWRDLHSLGVPEDQLYTEAFFSH